MEEGGGRKLKNSPSGPKIAFVGPYRAYGRAPARSYGGAIGELSRNIPWPLPHVDAGPSSNTFNRTSDYTTLCSTASSTRLRVVNHIYDLTFLRFLGISVSVLNEAVELAAQAMLASHRVQPIGLGQNSLLRVADILRIHSIQHALHPLSQGWRTDRRGRLLHDEKLYTMQQNIVTALA